MSENITHYAVLNDDGLPVAWYNDDVFPTGEDGERNASIPEGVVEVSAEGWMECLENQGRRKIVDGRVEAYDPPPLPPAVPESVSERQFMQQLAVSEQITWDECFAYLGQGAIPERFAKAIDSLPDAMRNPAKAAFIGANSFERHNPTTVALGELIGLTSDQLDQLWIAAAAIL